MNNRHNVCVRKNNLKCIYETIFAVICLLSIAPSSMAAGIIPISSNDQTQSGSDFAQTLVTIFQKGIIPIFMLFGAVWLISTAISTMANGIKEAQERQRFDPLKNAIIKTAILIVVGGALLYLLDQVRTFSFGG